MFNLTKEERNALLFLTIIGLTGVSLDFFKKNIPASKSVVSLKEDNFKINLNDSDKASLMAVEGVGEKLAERILAYKKENGDFLKLDELAKIKGITAQRYQKLKGYFYLE